MFFLEKFSYLVTHCLKYLFHMAPCWLEKVYLGWTDSGRPCRVYWLPIARQDEHNFTKTALKKLVQFAIILQRGYKMGFKWGWTATLAVEGSLMEVVRPVLILRPSWFIQEQGEKKQEMNAEVGDKMANNKGKQINHPEIVPWLG